MKYEMITYIVKLLVFLPITLGLIVLIGKLNQNGVMGINKSKYMRIMDKIQISKDNSIFIAEIGNKKYLMGNSSNRVEILKELKEEELIVISSENKNKERTINIKNILRKGE